MSASQGVLRRFIVRVANLTTDDLRLTGTESLAVDQVAKPGMDMARAGRRFFGGAGGTGTATGRAPVNTLPTTSAEFMLWNGESAGGKSYVIEKIVIAQLSGTAAVGSAILAAISTAAVAAPTAATGYSSASASRGGLTTKAVWADHQTVTAPYPWMAITAGGNPATTTNGGLIANLEGDWIIQPGYALYANVLSGTGTSPLFLAFAQWSEVELDCE